VIEFSNWQLWSALETTSPESEQAHLCLEQADDKSGLFGIAGIAANDQAQTICAMRLLQTMDIGLSLAAIVRSPPALPDS
jgi:hypothetical protein